MKIISGRFAIFVVFTLFMSVCVESALATVGPVRTGVDPFDAEKEAMQQLARHDSPANRRALASVRSRCALNLYHYYRSNSDTGALELAAAYAASAVELDAARTAHWTVLGQLLAHLADEGYSGSRVLAIEALTEAVRLAPDDRAGRIVLGLNLMLDRQYREALDQLEPAIMDTLDRVDPQLVMAAGICYIRGPLTRRGVRFLDQVLARRPNLAYVRLSKAVLLENQNRRDEALRELQAVYKDRSVDQADRQYALDLKTLWQQYGSIGEVD